MNAPSLMPTFIRAGHLVHLNDESHVIEDCRPLQKDILSCTLPNTEVLIGGKWHKFDDGGFKPIIGADVPEGFRAGIDIMFWGPSLGDRIETVTQVYTLKKGEKDPGRTFFDTFNFILVPLKSDHFKWRILPSIQIVNKGSLNNANALGAAFTPVLS